MKTQKITIVEVAKGAGVSTATASRVLGQYGYVGEKTKERVLAVAAKLGYQPNKIARGLITGQTRTIGVIAGDISSPFYAAVLRGISDVVEGHGLGMLITNSDETLDREVAATKLLRENQVDGLIVSPCDVTDSPHLRAAVKAGMPMALIDRKVKGLRVDTVAVENIKSSRDAVRRLLLAGHRRVGIIAELAADESRLRGFLASAKDQPPEGLQLLSTSWQRLAGYLEAHRAFGLEVDPNLILAAEGHSALAAQNAALAALNENARPTALFCADGLMSVGTMSAISAKGLEIPRDLSLVCFDDLDWMTFVGPGIDAIAQPRRKLGRAAARFLLARIGEAEGAPRDMRLSPRMVARGSLRSIL
ncbi:LacI family DNA-binding transcriptional regulator [Sulfitobacter dubius]|jgi:LacI family transcriptional regulator, galactose operon repressor|uniref:LacI family DNA-binding transcriptional regulator n=1 Tax=Sulfitobacter dubius TaxID=218673 RepID=UPI0022AF30F8|nr:LacI family DNA-binding transcriptional regulator [Sulfitobacter dubius]MCZ4368268.1 LacI family DNA-binding transcriptional regulator [Sulfitobacter dubius]